MSTITVVEIVSAVFIGVLLIGRVIKRDEKRSSKCLNLCLLLMLLLLVLDAMSYTLASPVYSLAIRYPLNLAAVVMGGVNLLAYTHYCDALFSEKARINPWPFRVLKLLEILWTIGIGIEFVTGTFQKYDGGAQTAFSLPVYMQVAFAAFVIAVPIIGIVNVKNVGSETVIMLGIFSFVPVSGFFVSEITESDCSVVFGAVTLALVAEFIQFQQIWAQKKRLEETDKIIGALAADYGGVNYIEITEDNLSDIAVGYRTSEMMKELIPGWDEEKNFTKRLDLLYENVVYAPDKEQFYGETRRKNVVSKLRDADSYSVYTRFFIDNKVRYYEIKFSPVRENGVMVGVVAGLHSVDEQRRRELEEQHRLEVALSELQSANKIISEHSVITAYFLDAYTSAYYVGLDDLSYSIFRRTDELEAKYPIKDNFLETLKNYIDNEVVPADRRKLRSLIRPERVRAMLLKSKEVTHTFRTLSADGERTFIMSIIRGADDAHAGFGFKDITAEIEEENARQKEIEESERLINSVASAYNVAYKVNMSDDSFSVIRLNSNFISRETIDGFSSFTQVKESLRDLLHPREIERVTAELDFNVIRKKLEEKSSYNFEYRVLINGTTSWHELNITKIDENEFAIGFAENDLEITKRRLEDKRYGEYFALFVADTETKRLKVIKNRERFDAAREGESYSYTETLTALAEVMDDEPKEFLLQISDIDCAAGELLHDDKRTYSYRSTHLEEGQWVEITSYVLMRYPDGTPATFTIGFSIVDALATSREEFRRQLQASLTEAEIANEKLAEQSSFTRYFLEPYDSAYYVGLSDLTWQIYKRTKQLEENYPTHENYCESLGKYIENEVHPEDRETVSVLIRPDEVKRRLEKAPSFSFTYRKISEPAEKTLRCEVMRGADSDHIAFGFIDVTDRA